MKNQNADFSTYQLQDLLDNKSFVNWVLQPNEQLDLYWQKNFVAYPNLSTEAPAAKRIISSLQFKPDSMDQAEKDALWNDINTAITGKRKSNVIPMWLRTAAAAIVTGILITVAFHAYQTRNIYESTEYGQVKTVNLPDGSEITLNANSRLKYAANWRKDQPRQVWVDGEAYFKVNHLHRNGNIAPGERFIVHAGKANIEVLGTTFNVNDRRNDVNVELLTGKISFSLSRQHRRAVILHPGEQIQYVGRLDTIIKKVTNGIPNADWKNGIVHFKNTSVNEVFQYIADVYGYQTVLKGPEIARRKISGDFSNNNLDGLIKALSTSLNLSIQKDSSSHQLIVNY